MNARGHKIYYGGRSDSLFLQKCKAAGFETLSLKIGADLNPFTIKELASFFRENKIEIIISERNKDIRLAGLAGRLNGKKLHIVRTGLASIKNNFRYRFLYPKLYNGIIIPTEAIRKIYQSYKWINVSSMEVIPNGIYPVALPTMKAAEIKSRLGVSAGKQIIGIFGKLSKKKQHTIFLEIAANVLKTHPDTIFLIVGDGPERQRLQEYAFELGILDNVYMVGFQEDLFPIYSICNMVLLTSQEEGIPQVIMEAMLMKRLVIAFDVGGISELISNEKNGILVPPNDIYLMTQRVEQFLIDSYEAERIGAFAREFILKNFTIQKMIVHLEAYFQKMLNKIEES
ncbi:hypothetical protein B1H10_08055 [candidate division KSB1 bacterium 4484_188]|nr:MAG: hypothetical protein B1H10_08055 [candidate division KSB1 bacterium 4484_188]